MNYRFLFVLLFLLPSCQPEAPQDGRVATIRESKGQIQLTSIPSAQSNIKFNNQLQETPNLNLFIWNFLYTGAGVATGDFNNDGLPDIYFAGNSVDDQLYFNKGNFVFEEVTQRAMIDGKGWSTGVTTVDINADGWLDIYVCKNSPTGIAEVNRNKLFVNQQNGTFSEQAETYGIADIGLGIQASFFDLDNDGDLDMYLVNQPFDQYALRVNKPAVVKATPTTDRLFINESGKYVDQTEALGLTNNKYGLNIALGDFDFNGWTDLYVCNDYDGADQLYINKNGRLKDEIAQRTGHISRFSMGADVGDVNQDGQLDIFTLDMAFQSQLRSKTNMESMNPAKFWNEVQRGDHYQYAQNNLQLNTGQGHFAEVAQVSGLAKTDWSAAPLFVDLDTDGCQDVLITNGILRDLKNNDYREYLLKQYGGSVGPQNLQDAMSKMPSNPIANLLYQNEGDLQFSDISTAAGFDFQGFSQGMAYADFDQDGKMDVVINNMNAAAQIYKNDSKNIGSYLNLALKGPGVNRQGLGCTVVAYQGDAKQVACMQTTRGFLSASEAILHFGFGAATTLDSLEIIWNERERTLIENLSLNRKMSVAYSSAIKIPLRRKSRNQFSKIDKINYQHKESPFDDYRDQILLPYKLSQNGPFMASGDINQDGLEDLFIGGAAGQVAEVHLQTPAGKFVKTIQPALQLDAATENMEASLADLDGDGDLDLFLSNGSNEFPAGDARLGPRAYEHTEYGLFQPFPNFAPATSKINGQSHALFDADGDYDLDIFIGGRLQSGQYPQSPASEIWLNDSGNWTKLSEEQASFLNDLGLVTAVIPNDLDDDGDIDLFVVGEWMAPTILINSGKGSFTKKELSTVGTGLWWTAEAFDADGDGDQDFLLGNLGWNNKFGGRHPSLEVYSSDFDNNGDNDVVLAISKDGNTYPVRGRECSSQEMPFVLEKFPSYEAFGNAELSDILDPEQLKSSVHKKINTFSSVLLRNNGKLNFTLEELPLACQLGPIKAFAIFDINSDGKDDFIFGGNHFPTEVETARYDGLSLGIGVANENGEFNIEEIFTGKVMDVRDLDIISVKGMGEVLSITVNNGKLEMLKLK